MSRMSPAALATVHLVVALGMLVIVPLGLRLIDDRLVSRLRRYWLAGAVPAALAPLLPRGTLAVLLTVPYAVAAVALAGCAAARLHRTRSLAPRELAVLTALVSPAIAVSAALAERAGYRLFGFTLDMLVLTPPHFHFAGFAAALVAGLLSAAVPGRAAAATAVTVPAGTLLVMTGHFVGPLVELAGAVVLTAGMWTAAWLTTTRVLPGADRGTRWLLGVGASVLAATMLLALWWAVGRAFELPHPSLSWMVLTHGLANALGFGLCSVLAWRRLSARRPLRERVPGH